ncbi:AAA family ATPase [Planctomycetota bacterium]
MIKKDKIRRQESESSENTIVDFTGFCWKESQMIKKINKLKNFGVFYDFSWQGLEEFKKFNLIYGWNYSGKTTLSRTFSCFEFGVLPKGTGYENAAFDFELKDGSRYDQTQLNDSFDVRVFNSDFIRENLKWEEKIEPVLLVGKENIKLEKQLESLIAELKDKEAKRQELQRFVLNESDKIEIDLRASARRIKNQLNIPGFEKPNFKHFIRAVASNPTDHQLPNEEYSLCHIKYICNQEEKILEHSFSTPDMAAFCKQTDTLLKITATGSIIERLKENPALQKWVKDGLELHKDKTECEFCNGKLRSDLLDKLNAHFSDEYDNLLVEINQLISILEDNKVSLKLHDKARFYEELQSNYKLLKEKIKATVEVLNQFIDGLIKNLENKKLKPFEAVKFEKPLDNTEKLHADIEAINALIRKHNSKTDKFEAERDTAKNKLIKHEAADFAIRTRYTSILEEIGKTETEIREIAREQSSIQSKISEIRQKLSEAVKGSDKISDYLHCYFGNDEIKMKVAEDEKYFKLERFGRRADNLSEGEKTAIAFSYFMTTLEDRGTTLSDTIIFVDDPVSSLDCNHLYHTYSFINSKLAGCKQLFISTHNFEFFNLIKDWFLRKNGKVIGSNKRREDGDQKDLPCEFYMLKNFTETEADIRKAHIKPLEKTLKEFKSEYHFLFDQLYKFKDNNALAYKDFYTISNIARRFLEIFTNFKIPTTGDLKSKFEALEIDSEKFNAIQKGQVYKLIQVLSHGFDPTSAIEHKDKTETLKAIKIMLEMVEDSDENEGVK